MIAKVFEHPFVSHAFYIASIALEAQLLVHRKTLLTRRTSVSAMGKAVGT